MSALASIKASPIARTLVGAVLGAVLAVGIGLVAVALAPEEGFGDLAAAAITLVFGIPAGALIGGFLGWWMGRDKNARQGPGD